ncbi:restriction endonuclease [Streptomyces sp. ME02-6979.5a]|uniref:nSTAND3 domain-containing NTPase n=1 Tax=Streptomyces sp. ME02-6979.5a TaxID=462925 RepID=UPI0029B301C2|nr:restriction endonuclease [Streptomyces sp. ME02-6979.5a]MDX3337268.1 restriction endonuclease [Streptomyces sp. ME02-6979.5a]
MDLLDLQKLSDLDFEGLCKDMFERLLGVRLEIFSSGPDGGIDLRYFSPNQTIIIQCKHWAKSGRAKLIAHLFDGELPKLDRMQPTPIRYILATSVEMTPAAKEKILDGFRPYIQSTGDIHGIAEITSFLQNNPEVVRKNMRLWLNDASILESMISKNVIQRSLHLVGDIKETLRTYVPSVNLRKAMSLVEKNHVVLVSGPPGVGKTTLAHVICAHYADRGFEVVEVSENVEDVYRVWHEKEPQIFIYDDFLGQTSLDDKLHKNEDSRLLSIIRRIRADPTKRFVCTTREYVLQQARQRYERMDRGDLEPLTFTVDIDVLGREERAQILYNHVYWSEWPNSAKRVFSHPEVYRPLIRHRSFNPRAIADLLSVPFDPERGEPGTQLVAALNDPMSLWRHVFDHQLKESDREVLYLLFTFGGKADLSTLGNAYLVFSNRGLSDFKASLKILNGTLISLSGEGVSSYVEFSNPSVNDFMLIKFSEESDLLKRVLSYPYSFDQVALLWSYHDAPADAEIPARLSLIPFQAEVEQAALATLDRDETATHSRASRAALCLSIAGSMHVPSVEDWAVRKIGQPGFVYRGSTGDITALIRITHGSTNRRIRQLHDSVRLEGLTSLFNRNRSECGLFIAASHAMDLAEFVDDGIRENLCRQADEEFEVLLDQYSRDSDDVDPDIVNHGLQYALRYGELWQHKWPSAATVLEGWLPEEADIFEGSDEESDVDPEYVDGDVYLTMNSLSFLE